MRIAMFAGFHDNVRVGTVPILVSTKMGLSRFRFRWLAVSLVVLGLSGCKSWDTPDESLRHNGLSQQVRQARASQREDRDSKPAVDEDFLMSDKAKKTWHDLD
jgi:hypothetical protein